MRGAVRVLAVEGTGRRDIVVVVWAEVSERSICVFKKSVDLRPEILLVCFCSVSRPRIFNCGAVKVCFKSVWHICGT